MLLQQQGMSKSTVPVESGIINPNGLPGLLHHLHHYCGPILTISQIKALRSAAPHAENTGTLNCAIQLWTPKAHAVFVVHNMLGQARNIHLLKLILHICGQHDISTAQSRLEGIVYSQNDLYQ